MDVAVAVLGGAVVAWAAGETALSTPDRPERGTLAPATAALVGLGHVGGVAEHLVRGGAGWIAPGTALLALGIALRLWSIAALGDAFATALDSPRLVTTGPYRWLRHPSEVGLALAMIGAAVLLASWIAAAAAVIALPIAVARCRREHAALVARFGERYA